MSIPLLSLIDKAIDKLFPDPAQRDAAKLSMLQAERSGELDQLKAELSVLLAEAQSADPFTSRARPSFLYVVYVLILFGIPMGLLSLFDPSAAKQIAAGFNAWLQAIPESLVDMFTVVMCGYVAGRSWEKVKGRK